MRAGEQAGASRFLAMKRTVPMIPKATGQKSLRLRSHRRPKHQKHLKSLKQDRLRE